MKLEKACAVRVVEMIFYDTLEERYYSRFHNYGPLRFFVYLLRTSILTAEFIVK